MRIIGGKYKGIHLKAPENLPVRPTTDMAKEALFNILNNSYELSSCNVLDLFCGTGNISFEFASRDAATVTAVDKHPGCLKWMEAVQAKYPMNIRTHRSDVFRFLEAAESAFDIIFADPPYYLPSIPQIPGKVLDNNLLAPNGTLIVEHPRMLKMSQLPGFMETRTYGNSSFSFFENSGIT